MMVIADSPMFATLVAQNAPVAQKGTALTIVNSIGFAITIVSIQFINWIKDCARTAELVLSVCTGSLLLAKAGLLESLEATTHHQVLDLLRELAPNTNIIENQRFVDNGKIITSGGIAAGIDMSLHVVGKLLGTAQAEQTAEHMEYKIGNW